MELEDIAFSFKDSHVQHDGTRPEIPPEWPRDATCEWAHARGQQTGSGQPGHRRPHGQNQAAHERLHGLVPGSEAEDGPGEPQDAQLRDQQATTEVFPEDTIK